MDGAPDNSAGGEAQRVVTRPRVLRCRHCRNEVSLTGRTIMHATRTPLQVWFWAAYLVTTQAPGLSALQFQRQLAATATRRPSSYCTSCASAWSAPTGTASVVSGWSTWTRRSSAAGREARDAASPIRSTALARSSSGRSWTSPGDERVRWPLRLQALDDLGQGVVGGVRHGERGTAQSCHHRWMAGLRQLGNTRMRPRARRAWWRPLKSGAGATLDPPGFLEPEGVAAWDSPLREPTALACVPQ